MFIARRKLVFILTALTIFGIVMTINHYFYLSSDPSTSAGSVSNKGHMQRRRTLIPGPGEKPRSSDEDEQEELTVEQEIRLAMDKKLQSTNEKGVEFVKAAASTGKKKDPYVELVSDEGFSEFSSDGIR